MKGLSGLFLWVMNRGTRRFQSVWGMVVLVVS